MSKRRDFENTDAVVVDPHLSKGSIRLSFFNPVECGLCLVNPVSAESLAAGAPGRESGATVRSDRQRLAVNSWRGMIQADRSLRQTGTG